MRLLIAACLAVFPVTAFAQRPAADPPARIEIRATVIASFDPSSRDTKLRRIRYQVVNSRCSRG